MKKFKKIMAVLVAAVMIAATMVPAWAANSHKITIKSRATDATGSNTTTYDWYEILVADFSDDSIVVDPNEEDGILPSKGSPVAYYTASDQMKNLLAQTNLFTINEVTLPGNTKRYYISLTDDSTTAEQIATALNTDAIKTAAKAHDQVAANGKADVVITAPEDGYYLIVASNGTKLIVQTLDDVTIKEKNFYPSVDKNVTHIAGTAISGGDTAKANDANIGDVISYSVPVTIPATAAQKKITVTDTISNGLTLNTAVTATVVVNDSTRTVNITGLTFTGNAPTYSLDIPADKVAEIAAAQGGTVTLTYTATLNAGAAINGTGNINKVKIQYDNYTSLDVETVTRTHKFELLKTDNASTPNALDGVTFRLTNSAGKYYVGKSNTATDTTSVWSDTATNLVTANGGKLKFEGLDSGIYTLTEVDTVKGYIMMTKPIVVTIAQDGSVTYICADESYAGNKKTTAETVAPGDNYDYVITMVNVAGTQLPATGGSGTVVLYIVGGMLVILAGAYLFFSRKKVA